MAPGPTRELTRAGFRLTKRGSGRPLGPSVMVCAGAAALCANACGAPTRAPRMAALRARRSDAKPDTFVPFGAGPSDERPFFFVFGGTACYRSGMMPRLATSFAGLG
ncbi:exported hypothetical protein [Mesorhizobium sp. ORS 3359]|nr:exported hypothetical protein [Mesorhizobium sp. ORS 3359]